MRNPFSTALALVIACAGLGACGTEPTSDAAAPSARNLAPSRTDPTEYIIGSGDTISVFVYHAPELSQPTVPVRPDGRISVPLIQDIAAAGKTPAELGREIEQRLRKYVQEPNVTVIVQNFVGPFDRQVKVIGQAAEPVALPYRDNMTLLDVMIATKGLSKFAAGNRAVIVRRAAGGKQQTVRVRLADLMDGDVRQNVAMQPGDTLIVPESWF